MSPPYGSRCCNVPRFICWLRHYIKCLLPYLSYKVTFFPCLFTFLLVPSVLWCCWSGWCHCHSLSLASVKSRLVLPFWYRLTRVVPEIGPLNGCVCVCVYSLSYLSTFFFHFQAGCRKRWLNPALLLCVNFMLSYVLLCMHVWFGCIRLSFYL